MHDLLHIEICQKADSALLKGEIEGLVYEEILAEGKVDLDCVYYGEKCKNETLKTHVESFLCTYDDAEKHQIKIEGANIKFYTYRLTQEDVATETIQTDSEQLSAASHWILPAKEFHYLWENLFYDSEMKENLLHFVQSTMIFSDKNVNSTIISWNKVILLHGPPGTGKTSLCKAIAQKAAIRLGDRFTHGELIEINSHSLFSKWFSESGKLVMQLFNEIKTLLENPNALVCVLIDEIESLAHVRKSCANGIEPTDSIRVVNALLTQLDHIKRFPNVLILTTSNMTESIDLAFVDRADIKLLVGHPNVQCIYKIFSTCLKELMRILLSLNQFMSCLI
ncbi:pachytene checkpoint protein 2 homolog isoform X2 [Prorops nasuta]|uniref:pachytene checkpoint protein 2 homolog isoform X2 n=1 Tax=Prorops nasuta TaxID=863751 RepID=UPI0034CF7594